MKIISEEALWPGAGVHGVRLVELMSLSQEEFSARFKKSPVERAKRRGLLRNVAVALGNWSSPGAVPVLRAALNEEEPLIRGVAAWALGRIGTPKARAALEARAEVEGRSHVLPLRSTIDQLPLAGLCVGATIRSSWCAAAS